MQSDNIGNHALPTSNQAIHVYWKRLNTSVPPCMCIVPVDRLLLVKYACTCLTFTYIKQQ